MSPPAHAEDETCASKLTDFYSVNGVVIEQSTKPGFEFDGNRCFVKLSDDNLSAALEFLYRIGSKEILSTMSRKEVEKVGVEKDGILFCKSRMLEGQALESVGGLVKKLNLQSLVGVDFNVHLVHRNSPLAMSIALHLHK